MLGCFLATEYNFSVGMALVDFVPCVLFMLASIVLQRCFYNKMSKGAFALYSSGTICVMIAGFCKALWKLLYASNVCDFEKFNYMFFPLQSIGFLLASIGMIGLMFFSQKEKGINSQKVNGLAVLAFAPLFLAELPVVSGTMLFVSFNIIGVLILTIGYSKYALKLNKPVLIVLFAFAFIFTMAMGYLSTKNFEKASMNWIAEVVNMLGQGCLLAGALLLKKNGLEELQ